jgi:CheY-like chemotaxis protein
VSSVFPAARPDVVGGRGRILVVDPEAAIRSVLARMLGTEHEVVTAASGLAARRILEHDTAFDVILCDLMMPELTGMDLHRWLTTEHPLLAAKVVFMTGGAFTPNASEYLVQVGNRQLEKPYEVAKLRPLMLDLVARAKRQH